MERDLTSIVPRDVAHSLTAKVESCTRTPESAPLRGSVLVLIQFDVCEEIRLDALRQIVGARTAQASFKKAPAYVRYQRPPVEETLEPLILHSGERLTGE